MEGDSMPDLTNMEKFANYKAQMGRLNHAIKEHLGRRHSGDPGAAATEDRFEQIQYHTMHPASSMLGASCGCYWFLSVTVCEKISTGC
jgi:hypothetical protein